MARVVHGFFISSFNAVPTSREPLAKESQVGRHTYLGGNMKHIETTYFNTRNTQRRERKEAVVAIIGFSLIVMLLAFI
jgi:hypothetical protein